MFAKIRDFLYQKFKRRERYLFLVLTIAFVGGLGAIAFGEYTRQTVIVASHGGRHIEGMVGNRAQLTEIVTRLTNVGLVSLTASRDVLPALAKEWTISPDGKEYTFKLYDGLVSEDLANILREQETFRTTEIKSPDPATLVFLLKQPFGPFLSLLSLPLLPDGPYTVLEEREDSVTLEANPYFAPGQPYLDQITIKIFADEQSLQQAAARQEITGAVTDKTIPHWRMWRATLPRKIVALFNTDREVMKNIEVRRNLIQREVLTEKVSLTLVTTPQLQSYAEDLMTRWRNQNLDVTLKLFEDAELQKNVIPKRDYDCLVYGLDEGAEPDPYRFWHSSQATESGLNLTQVRDADLDRLLAAARRIMNDTERFAKYDEIERRVAELAVMIPLEEVAIAYQISEKIQGVEEPLMISPASRYNLVWKWYTKGRRVRKTD